MLVTLAFSATCPLASEVVELEDLELDVLLVVLVDRPRPAYLHRELFDKKFLCCRAAPAAGPAARRCRSTCEVFSLQGLLRLGVVRDVAAADVAAPSAF